MNQNTTDRRADAEAQATRYQAKLRCVVHDRAINGVSTIYAPNQIPRLKNCEFFSERLMQQSKRTSPPRINPFSGGAAQRDAASLIGLSD
jgi:hypothetical protein